MKIIIIPRLGNFAVNCYLAISDAGNAVMIDCPKGEDKILKKIQDSGAKLKKILLTHGHCDHIESLAKIAEATGAEVYIHELDAPKLTNSEYNLSNFFAEYLDGPVQHYEKSISVKDGDVIKQDELEFTVMHTPGHTSGSVCYTVDNVMFTGDTLFNDNIGRTDMIDGNYDLLVESLHNIAKITKDYRILPGHNNETTLQSEKEYNSYLS